MIVIRKFKDQLLDSIATWGPCDAFGEFLPRAVEDSIQINVLVAKNTKRSKHSNRLGNGATAYYLFSPTDDCQAEIDELLLAHKVVGIAQLLTRRELDVIKEIFDLDNTSKVAAKLGITSMLSINFLPNAIYKPERCIRTTLEAAKKYNFPIQNIMFEFTEVEKIEDTAHIKRIVDYYQSLGFKTATDDFGAGYSGLNLLADFQTDIIKLDMALIRDINNDKKRQLIVTHCLNMFRDLNITALAEGIETVEEYKWLKNAGVELMQGYLFAKPSFENLPEVNFKDIGAD